MKDFLNHSGKRIGLLALIAVMTMSLTYFAGDVSYLLRTSIIGYPEHEAFDGTVYPVQKVPNWSELDAGKWDMSYGSLSTGDLMNIPYYDPSQLRVSADSLKWGDAADNVIRNAKITYSVPYMGNYKLDGVEYGGSHLAVDIKIPNGTPVYAIANGTVIKTSNQTSGFGHHIVVQHNNFPTLDNPNASETMYSSYSHLGNVMISEGDVISKGEQIATSGATGTASTPHLHFQMDNDEAPWHPYWPFTWSEASDAGLDFYSAVNAGLGKENGIATTVNPMKYVQAYLDGEYVAADNNDDSANPDSYVPEEDTSEEPVAEEPEVVEEPEVIEEPEVVEEPEVIEEVMEPEEEPRDPPVINFEFEVLPKYYIGQGSDFSIFLRDQYGEKFEGFTGDIVVQSVNNKITSSPAIVTNLDFDKSGILSGEFKNMKEGRDKLLLEYNGQKYYSGWFVIEDPVEKVSFTDVPEDHEYYNAINYLVTEGVVAGYPDGTFRPDKTVSRVEALKFIYEGLKESISSGNLPFSDVSKGEWYGSYLYTAYKDNVVDGYPDGTFKPSKTVNKAEFYKILFNGMKVDISPKLDRSPFKDVDKNEWFAPFVAYAKEIGIIDPNTTTLKPSEGMSRGEVAYAIYKLMLLMK